MCIRDSFIETGVYDRRRPFHVTTSPSMDILVSSNLERLLYFLSKDAERVAGWMKQLGAEGRYDVGAELREACLLYTSRAPRQSRRSRAA